MWWGCTLNPKPDFIFVKIETQSGYMTPKDIRLVSGNKNQTLVFYLQILYFLRLKESTCNAGDLGLIPGLEPSPGEWNGNPLQFSYLVSPHRQRNLAGTVHGVSKNRTRLSNFHLLLGKSSMPSKWDFSTYQSCMPCHFFFLYICCVYGWLLLLSHSIVSNCFAIPWTVAR